MKKIILPAIMALTLVACRKTSSMEETQSLTVSEQNMSAMGKVTATWCGPCGSWGFPKFAGYETDYAGKAVFMAFKDNLIPGGRSEDLYSKVGDMFKMDVSGVPTFWVNFKKGASEATAVAEHNSSPVIVNSNYDLSVSGNKVNLKTTTKFFKSVEGEYLLAPYMIVDGIVAPQNGHPDTPNTTHHKFVADVAKPTTTSTVKNWGYKIGSGKIKAGHTVTLEFEADRDPSWNASDISFGLIMVKEQGDSLVFVNAFTK